MGGSPRGPSRRHDAAHAKIPSAVLIVTATCVLMLLSWRAGLLETLSNKSGLGDFGGGGSSVAPLGNTGVAVSQQPVTAYGHLLRERGLLPVTGSSEDYGALATRAECASAYPSITEHLLRDFHLPSLDVGDDDDDDDDADSAEVAAEVEAEKEEEVEGGEGEDEGEGEAKTKKATMRSDVKEGTRRTKKKKKRGGFVYHRGSSGGDVEGVHRDPEPRHGSCAVVGSSRALLGAQHGGEIDSHDAVIRFDDAPTRGFENILGRRTTYRVASSSFVASVAAGAAAAVKNVNGSPRVVPGAKALVVGEDTSGEQQREVREKVPGVLLYPVSLGVTDKVEDFYKEFAKRVNALTTTSKAKEKQATSVKKNKISEAEAAGEVPVSLIGVFFAMHSCDEVHVYGFAPPGAEQHLAEDDYYTTNTARNGKGSTTTSTSRTTRAAGLADDVTRLILRVLALEGHIHNHPS